MRSSPAMPSSTSSQNVLYSDVYSNLCSPPDFSSEMNSEQWARANFFSGSCGGEEGRGSDEAIHV